MTTKFISKTDLTEVLNRLMEHYRVYAPVRQGDMANFQLLSPANQADFTLANTTLSPKFLMLPQSERMFEFILDMKKEGAGILRETEKDSSPRLILGIRPCDAKAFQLLDLNFATPSLRDPWWTQRRQSTTLAGLGCNDPCSTCFCTSVGSGPFSKEGLDMLLTDLGDGFAIEPITERGEQLLHQEKIETEAGKDNMGALAALQQRSQQAIGSVIPVDNLKNHEARALFNAPFWEEVQFACINCGVCTFVCPTCWCFDIQDEVREKNGVRLRNWDTCMFPLFTLHGSGHNPRSQKLQRVRQRFMHKLKYFVDKYEKNVACVGCGRCVQQCPVNIDIREVLHLMGRSAGSVHPETAEFP